MKTKLLSTLFGIFAGFLALTANAANMEAEKAKYQTLTNEVIQAVVSENLADINGLKGKLEEATKLGLEMASTVSASNPDGKQLLDFLAQNVGKIKTSNLEAIEHDWHHGGAFKAAGIKHDEFDHYGAVIGAKDAVVHPLTALAALNQYEATKNPEFLETAQAELEEIIGQLKYIK